MNGKYLLDTNIIIAIFAKEKKIIDRLVPNVQVFVPIVALGELYFGAQRSTRINENLKKIDELASASNPPIRSRNSTSIRSDKKLLKEKRKTYSGK